jgi:hypothetical protein
MINKFSSKYVFSTIKKFMNKEKTFYELLDLDINCSEE